MHNWRFTKDRVTSPGLKPNLRIKQSGAQQQRGP